MDAKNDGACKKKPWCERLAGHPVGRGEGCWRAAKKPKVRCYCRGTYLCHWETAECRAFYAKKPSPDWKSKYLREKARLDWLEARKTTTAFYYNPVEKTWNADLRITKWVKTARAAIDAAARAAEKRGERVG